MKVKKLFIVITMLTVFMLQPVGGNAASSLDKINKDLAAAKKQIEQAQQIAKNADQKKEDIAGKKEDAQQAILKLNKQLNQVADNLNYVQDQVDTKEEELQKAGKELVKAEEQVKERDALLQSRLKLMYENGVVSYLDVLFSATSFSDFLDRFDSLQSILSQDRSILEQHKKDKAMVAEKKVNVETALGEVKTMYTKLQKYKSELNEKEEEKEVLIANYNKEMEELEDISEEQEQQLIALAKKVSDLNKQKNSIKNPYSGGKLGMPIRGTYRISSNYGYRIHPITHVKKLHTGIDFAAKQGTDIYAAESGIVIVAQVWSGYGNAVIIDHGNGLWTLYGHIRNGGIKVEKGQSVKKGQKIAEVGSTGNSTGPHLHFEVRKNEATVDPAGYLK
ncbi:Murein DD-endopeptidase MepM and murein hydrolase activator NlpD, contain LysM domain [Paenibacillus catalpae]|uniref:Murein DD-endopeptidase MepM and murein hydrolase activator NlpD, contain LysM domain n=1 Tax=Paenibacillus catalpae TaxID=1045775 RepID=A0A1I2H6T6_9BACL|nr:peptidoglycan DD-metalloendopeptidase family protein [Paenibacillus catalpae]SFF25268.1 Murein DD-endopeptidase MepM and murein hydrolase activator NlpD, contain LysM domain [Paenibacillus catalpae]